MEYFLSKYKAIFKIKLVIIIGICFQLFYFGCSDVKEKINKVLEKKQRFLIILVDETPSFVIEERGVKTKFWEVILPWVIKIAETLSVGEKFCVIGIDDHGGDPMDIRIPVKTIGESASTQGSLEQEIAAEEEKKKIIEQIKNLSPRAGITQTDIIGALCHAAIILKQQSTHRGVIVIFSDMVQTAPDRIASTLKFPDDTEVYCFFVNATKGHSYLELRKRWISIFTSANLIYSPRGEDSLEKSYFYEPGAIGEDLFNKLFKR